MRLLLLNDTTMKKYFEKHHEVRACGPVGSYPMPDQARFDFQVPWHTAIDLDQILAALSPFTPDVIIHFEACTNIFYRGIEKAPCPTIWRTVDNHIHGWQPLYAPTHDVVLVAQKDYLPLFEEVHDNAFWLPLCSFPDVHHDRGLERTIAVGFAGSTDPRMHAERARFFSRLTKRVPVDIRSGLDQEALSHFYNQTKIVINQSIQGDLNYRVFEAMANGAMLLTPRIENGLPLLFQDGVELVTYTDGDVDEAAAALHYYLSHEEERERIAAAGARQVKNHSVEARALQILRWIEERLPAAFAGRKDRLTIDVHKKLATLYAALHSSRFAPPSLAVDALEEIAERAPELALRMTTRLENEVRTRLGPDAARAYHDLRVALEEKAIAPKSMDRPIRAPMSRTHKEQPPPTHP